MPVKYSELKSHQYVSIILSENASQYDHENLRDAEIVTKEKALELLEKGVITGAHVVTDNYIDTLLTTLCNDYVNGENDVSDFYEAEDDGELIEFNL